MYLQLKRCTQCGLEKPLESGFSRDRRLKSGRASACRDCKNQANKTWRVDHSQERQAYAREWYRVNGVRIRAQWRAWYQRNKAARLAYGQRWRLKNYGMVAARERLRNRRDWRHQYYARTRAWHASKFNAWRLANLDRRAWTESQRRARARTSGRITLEEWRTLVAHFLHRCLACGRQDRPLTVDHIVAIARGGTNVIDNAQPLCHSCNSRKHAKTIDYRKHGAGQCQCDTPAVLASR